MKIVHLKVAFLIIPFCSIIGMSLDGIRFIYQEDLSEYCKRRVIPSVFLGRHVMNADAKMMHFSRLDTPYSCMIGVRTESGSHIILVAEIQKHEELKEMCEYGDQFLAYQLSETFGGFWGIFPESVYEPFSPRSTYYTMSVASTTAARNNEDRTETKKPTPAVTPKTPAKVTVENQNMFVMEVPLVNISGYVVPANKPIQIDQKEDRVFDKYFDVTPRVGFSYDTQIVPLVEVSPIIDTISTKPLTRQLHYKVGQNSNFYRISFRPTPTSWRLTTRMNRLRNTFFPKILGRKSLSQMKRSVFVRPNTNFLSSISLLHSKEETINKGYGINLLTTVKGTSNILTENTKKNELFLPSKFSGMESFKKVIAKYNYLNSKSKLRSNGSNLLRQEKEDNKDINISNNKTISLNVTTERNLVISPPNAYTVMCKMNTLSINETNNLKNKTAFNNYESDNLEKNFKNGVENKTLYNPKANKNKDKKKNGHLFVRERKRKRYIEAIQIDNAIPWIHQASSDQFILRNFMDSKEIVKNIAELLELTADEVEGRVSRGNLYNYMSESAVFNICEHKELKQSHIMLFNTSRIFLMMTNFNLQGMTIILTGAETMDNSNERCLETQLECQVSGHRVCIDASCACDGIPNCGSYDIYDEDKLRCSSIYMSSNMYFAVVAFVVLIITIMYAVYFWLQRCVADVSEAFFVYITGTDNILNLDSIMKSPNETDEATKLLAQQSYLEDMTTLNIDHRSKVRNLCVRCCLFLICRKAKKDIEFSKESHELQTRHLYSFTQLELSRMIKKANVETGIQTGESIELDRINLKKTESKDLKTSSKSSQKVSQELKLLKITRSQTSSGETNIKKQSADAGNIVNKRETREEVEIIQVETEKSKGPLHEELTTGQNVQMPMETVKKIRFEEYSSGLNDAGQSTNKRLQSMDVEPTTSKDQKWFWNKDSNKTKKSKK